MSSMWETMSSCEVTLFGGCQGREVWESSLKSRNTMKSRHSKVAEVWKVLQKSRDRTRTQRDQAVTRARHLKCRKCKIRQNRGVARNPSHWTGVIGKYV